MINYTTKEITHLRYLADAIALCPEKTHRFLNTLLEISKGTHFNELIIKHLQNRLPDFPTYDNINILAEELARNEETLVRRMGETLLWGLWNRGKRESKNL